MAKLIPLSLVLLSVVLPIALAVRPNPARTIRKVHVTIAVYIVIWAYLCLHVYTKYVFVD